jgi:hypothetical protein
MIFRNRAIAIIAIATFGSILSNEDQLQKLMERFAKIKTSYIHNPSSAIPEETHIANLSQDDLGVIEKLVGSFDQIAKETKNRRTNRRSRSHANELRSILAKRNITLLTEK